MLTSLPKTFRPDVTVRAFIEEAFDLGQRNGRHSENDNPFSKGSAVHEAYELGFSDVRGSLLIEAASDMLAALKVAEAALRAHGAGSSWDREQVLAAIAQAEGR